MANNPARRVMPPLTLSRFETRRDGLFERRCLWLLTAFIGGVAVGALLARL